MNIVKADSEDRKAIVQLLQSQRLPSDDLPEVLNDFHVAVEGKEIVGVIGMERYQQFGLLRSLVVHPEYRNQSIAESLVLLLEKQAAISGIHSLFLLTETAADYFSKKGYTTINRADVPEALLASSEFGHVCPVTATVMQKPLVQPVTILS